MSERLLPPEGYASWLDYAVDAMETRELFFDQAFNADNWRGSWRVVQRDEMQQAAKGELKRQRDVIRKLVDELRRQSESHESIAILCKTGLASGGLTDIGLRGTLSQCRRFVDSAGVAIAEAEKLAAEQEDES